jgi:hypothetical protein
MGQRRTAGLCCLLLVVLSLSVAQARWLFDWEEAATNSTAETGVEATAGAQQSLREENVFNSQALFCNATGGVCLRLAPSNVSGAFRIKAAITHHRRVRACKSAALALMVCALSWDREHKGLHGSTTCTRSFPSEVPGDLPWLVPEPARWFVPGFAVWQAHASNVHPCLPTRAPRKPSARPQASGAPSLFGTRKMCSWSAQPLSPRHRPTHKATSHPTDLHTRVSPVQLLCTCAQSHTRSTHGSTFARVAASRAFGMGTAVRCGRQHGTASGFRVFST